MLVNEQSFKYPLLSDLSNGTRLLRLLKCQDTGPDTGQDEQQLKCQLECVTLDAKPHYLALSYQWGKPGDIKTIDVDGQAFIIQRNLWTLLTQLRRHAAEESTVLWVDAICINQNEAQEKNNQIRIMDKIYKAAAEVLVWLGDADEALGRAFNHLNTWVLEDNNWQRLPQVDHYDEPGRIQDVFSPLFLADLTNLELWSAMYESLCRPYFGRAWIVQEVLLAKRVSFYAGVYHLKAECTPLLAILLQGFPAEDSIADRGNEAVESDDPLTAVVAEVFAAPAPAATKLLVWRWEVSMDQEWREKWKPGWGYHETTTSLSHHIEQNKDKKCVDAHDKIYAFIGLDAGIQTKRNFEVDYECSLIELAAYTLSFTHTQHVFLATQRLLETLRLTPSTTLDADAHVAWAADLLRALRLSRWPMSLRTEVEITAISQFTISTLKYDTSGQLASFHDYIPLPGYDIHIGDLMLPLPFTSMCLVYRMQSETKRCVAIGVKWDCSARQQNIYLRFESLHGLLPSLQPLKYRMGTPEPFNFGKVPENLILTFTVEQVFVAVLAEPIQELPSKEESRNQLWSMFTDTFGRDAFGSATTVQRHVDGFVQQRKRSVLDGLEVPDVD